MARCYRHRAPYAPALFDKLLALAPRRGRALDLGCGPGKIALVLAPHFDAVVAVDPSPFMIEVGKDGAPGNIDWICASAEEAGFGRFDIAAAGASIHWMKLDVVFPKLAAALAPDGLFATIGGDGACDPPWAEAERDFLTRWLARLGRSYDPQGFSQALANHESWLEIAGRESFAYDFSQPVEHYIAAQHARATWTRAAMGPQQAAAFDDDLRRVLAPFATGGAIRYRVESTLVWGRPLLSPHLSLQAGYRTFRGVIRHITWRG